MRLKLREKRDAIVGVACILCMTFLGSLANAENNFTKKNQREKWIVAANPGETPLPPSVSSITKEAYVSVDDGEIFYLDSVGDSEKGETIVLVHGNTGNPYMWGHQFETFQRAGYRVIAISLRGAINTTAAPVRDGQLNHQKQLDDIDAVILDSGAESVHLVGMAAGGGRALAYTYQHPDRVATLTLVGSILNINESQFTQGLVRLITPTFRAMTSDEKELSPSYRLANPQGVNAWLAIEAQSPAAYSRALPAEERSQYIINSGPSPEEISSLTQPVHFIYGGADLYSPPALARIAAPMFNNAQLTFLADTAHAPQWEQPKHFNKAVLRFICQKD